MGPGICAPAGAETGAVVPAVGGAAAGGGVPT
ncbi:MAG: hypothetical protein JWP31_2600, partial [Aeromicrobium sp.]|nr:hypothetical protein [Aeromicrobium sp.]